MIKGRRRLVAFLLSCGMVIAPDIMAGIGMSAHTAGAVIALCVAYFGNDGYVKGKRADNGGLED